MEKGINLSLTKSLAEFDALLGKAIVGVSPRSSLLDDDIYCCDVSERLQIGKYAEVDFGLRELRYWIGCGFGLNDKYASHIWLEINSGSCPEKVWDKITGLVGTIGEYYREIDFLFFQKRSNAWIRFFLKDEYLKQFIEGKTELYLQEKILTGFITEVLETCDGKQKQ